MKKIILVLLMLLLSLSAWARGDDDDDYEDEEPVETQVQPQESPPLLVKRKKTGIKNRTFELSLLNTNVNVSNDVVAAMDILKETAVFNIDDVLSGIRLDFGASITPLSLNFNWRDKWGMGLDLARVDVFGNVSLSGSILSLEIEKRLKTGAGAAVFVNVVGVPIFFHANNFKVKIRPSAYLPVVYAEPRVWYSFNRERLSLEYDLKVYSLISMEGIADDGMNALQDNFDLNDIPGILNDNLGFDLGLCVEYPLYPWLDLGVDIVNIPFIQAKLYHYLQLKDEVYVDTELIDILDLINGGEFPKEAYHYPEDFTPGYYTNSSGKSVYRPFKMLFYANYRFFDSNLLTLRPQLGFSINRLYPEQGSIEAGLSARLDLGNVFVTTLGTGYLDRNWKHSLDFIFNFRVFEIDLGVSVQSPDFAKSFRGAGAGVNFCLKMGI